MTICSLCGNDIDVVKALKALSISPAAHSAQVVAEAIREIEFLRKEIEIALNPPRSHSVFKRKRTT